MTEREFLAANFNSPIPGDRESAILELRLREFEANETERNYAEALEAWVKYEEAKLKAINSRVTK